MSVTPISQLKKYTEGMEVELPGFYEDDVITVALRRPSLFSLAQSGEIPNTLLATAAKLFEGGTSSSANTGEGFVETAKVMRIVAKASLVSPAFDEFENVGLTLTDQQLLYIYNFAQTGVDAVRMFRQKQKAAAALGDGKSVPKKAK